MKGTARYGLLVGTLVVVTAAMGGCIYSSTDKERVVEAPPAAPAVSQVPADRVVAYPGGRWTLYGDGTAASPHYWVWVPAGATPPPPPPLPRR